MDAPLFAVEADADQSVLLPLVGEEEDSLSAFTEKRFTSLLGDEGGFAAVGGNPVGTLFLAVGAARQVITARAGEDDFRTVGREGRFCIVPAESGDLRSRGTVGFHLPDRGLVVVVPRNVGDPFSVRGEGGKMDRLRFVERRRT